MIKTCDAEVWDGNRDDPTAWYCGLPAGHAGEHGKFWATAEQQRLIATGTWDPDCSYCRRFAPGAMMPSHTAMSTCRSGGYNHCTCDTCW